MHRCRERGDVVEQGERGEVIGTASEVATPLAASDQNAVSGRQTELADLNIGALVVKGDFTGYGNAAFVRSDVERPGRQPQLGGKALQA